MRDGFCRLLVWWCLLVPFASLITFFTGYTLHVVEWSYWGERMTKILVNSLQTHLSTIWIAWGFSFQCGDCDHALCLIILESKFNSDTYNQVFWWRSGPARWSWSWSILLFSISHPALLLQLNVSILLCSRSLLSACRWCSKFFFLFVEKACLHDCSFHFDFLKFKKGYCCWFLLQHCNLNLANLKLDSWVCKSETHISCSFLNP